MKDKTDVKQKKKGAACLNKGAACFFKSLPDSAKETIITVLEALILTAIILFAVSPVSCKLTGGIIELVSSDYECPKLVSYSVEDSSSMRFAFSQAVSLKGITVFPENSMSSLEYEYSVADSKSACFVLLKFNEPLKAGMEYSIYGNAKDSRGNSLSFCLPFLGYNSNVAQLEIIEVHPKYQGESKGNGIFKNEYVLFNVSKSGNLSSLCFISASDGEEKSCSFPSVEVFEGEKLALHLRNKGSGCVNETGSDFTLSTACYSKPDVRDLWQENENARLGDEQDVLVVLNTQDDKIVTAFCYASSAAMQSHAWKTKTMQELSERVFEEGFWEGGAEIENAFLSDGITASKSFIKNGKNNSSLSWKIDTASLK